MLYRPNPAKVKNLETKDYLGKARLVAASDRSNTFTGFAGAEKKPAITLESRAKDDRPTENVSYAASNLVQQNLNSRAGTVRDHSAPPTMNPNTMPPTPPPDMDKPLSARLPMTGRAASVRSPANRPQALQRSATTAPTQDDAHNGGLDMTSPGRSALSSRSRPSARRAASENRGGDVRRGRHNRLYGEVPEDSAAEDFYDMYQTPASSRPRPRRTRTRSRPRPGYIDEEEEYVSDEYEDDEFSDGEFEMVGATSHSGGLKARRPSSNRRTSSRRGEDVVRNIRVNIHHNEETRAMMIGLAVEVRDFESKLQAKFGLRRTPRILIQDGKNMITMRDQDDLDVLLASTKSLARKENQEMGQMEVRLEFP